MSMLCDMFCGEVDMLGRLAFVVLLLRTKSFLGVSQLRLELGLKRSLASEVSFSILLMVFLRTGGTKRRCVELVGVVLCE